MSKYSKSGKRSQSGAGNHFDKLLKVCSNSKVAGSLGRFGVASFTSLRGTGTASNEVQEEKKPKSKYSSFKKRSRAADASKSNANMPSAPPLSATAGGSALELPATTVLKPRKFFKSRGPMEIVGGANAPLKPARPEIGNLIPILPPSSVGPLIPSNTNTNTQYYDHHPKKHRKPKKLENLSSPPQTTGSSSDSSFTSPPIKLRIFKDRGKFVSEAPTASPILPPSSLVTTPKKRGRKPGSKNKKPGDGDLEGEEQKPPKQTKRAKQTQVAPPAPPSRSSGRTTRNSTRQRTEDTEDITDSTMPSLDRQLRNSSDGYFQSNDSDMYQQQPPPPQLMVDASEIQQRGPPAQEIIKNLEEDADFKKLSEMLSSMEGEAAGVGSNPNSSYSQQSSHQQAQNFSNTQSFQEQQQSYEGYHHRNNQSSSTTVNPGVSSASTPQGLSAFAAQYMQHQFRQQMQQQTEQPLIHQDQQQSYYGSSNSSYHSAQQQQHQVPSSVQLPQQQNLPKANDIRSILVDDWTDFDDETHSPTGHNRSRSSSQASHHSQSPPKFSRFDMSAFMPTSGASALHQQHSPQFPMPEEHLDSQEHFRSGQSHHQTLPQQQQQMPFNIHSSPYAMRNLLNCPPGSQEPHFPPEVPQDLASQQGSMHFSSCALESFQQHHHPAPLNSLSSCAKQEAISVLDSVLKQQEMTNEPASSLGLVPPSVIPKAQVAPSTKKASIFKSRAREQNLNGEGTQIGTTGDPSNNSKGNRRALYKHKFGGHDDSISEEQRQQVSQGSSSVLSEFDEDDDERINIGNLRNVRIKNVKAIHQLQESGEFHEFDGDVQYILEDLRTKNPMNIRCLSVVTLAMRCMEPSFRMHLRAHGTVAEFCRELHDSPQHPDLALLAALVLFVLSQDRLNMDLDTDTLKLILALSKADDVKDPESQNSQENLETLKHKQKVLDLCVEMKNRGHATHLKLDKITASELALETLLHLTSKRAGEWVKHELRALGGLDSIVNEVDCSLRYAQTELDQYGWTEGALERLRKVDRCLQVLQQVTFNHEHNQKYLLGQSERQIEAYEGGSHVNQKCVDTSPRIFVELFRFCKNTILQLPVQLESATVMREILFSVLRVLVNLSHDYRGIVIGSEILLVMDGFLQLCLHSTFEMGRYFPDEKIFDLLMHSLCMLLNLVEHSRACRNAILSSSVHKSSVGNYRVSDLSSSAGSNDSGVDEEIPVLDAFVEMFLCRERAAKTEEQHTDNILTKGPGDSNSSGQTGDSSSGNSSQDKNSQDSEGSSLQDTIDKLIQTAGKHMENSLIAAYISLLLAYIIMDNPVAANQVRNSMPNGQYLPLMIFLKKLFNFMSITSSASGSIRGLKATAIALRFFAQADPKSDEELKKLIPD